MADSTSSNKNEDILVNIIIVIIIIALIWFFFGPSKESFNEDSDSYDSGSMMSSYKPGNLEPDLTNTSPQYNSYKSIDNKAINSSDMTLTPDEISLIDMNKISQQDAKPMSCNLLGINPNKLSNYKKKFYSLYKHQIECPKNCQMNKLGMKKCGLDGDDTDCGGLFTTDYNNPDVFALSYLAVDKNNSKPCVTCTKDAPINNLNRSDIAEDVSVFDNSPLPGYNPKTSSSNRSEDFNVLEDSVIQVKNGIRNLMEGLTNDSDTKENFQNLMQGMIENYEDLPEDVKQADANRKNQKNVSNANVSNFVDFENNVYQNSIGETSVDKMAEIRTCKSGTCGLRSYGKSIANAFDKLLDTPAYVNRNSCNPNFINGVLEDAAYADNYQNM